MARNTGNITRFEGGISSGEKVGTANTCKFVRSLDFRTDPSRLELLPKTAKESGGIVTDLTKWGERVGTNLWCYGDAGNIYKRTSAAVWSLEHTAPDSSGNGFAYFGEDDYLYYTTDSSIGRYGQVNQTPKWYDRFLESEGGAPTNTNSLDLEDGSSQYASVADTAVQSITGDISIGVYAKTESLPTSGNEMVMVSKWLENGDQRAYKLSIVPTANSFGDGGDGALTISSDTTEAPVDSAATGTIATKALTATNASFAAGQKIMIHQTQGTGAGNTQFTEIEAYTAGTITTTDNLVATFATGAQVRVLKQYTNVTINSGKTYTTKAWDGTVGGILAFYANGTVTVTGNISANGGTATSKTGATGGGFRGGNGIATGAGAGTQGFSGEGSVGVQVAQTTANGNGGGGGSVTSSGSSAGGGGGNGAEGTQGTGVGSSSTAGGVGGAEVGTTDLTTLLFGGGGGGGAEDTDVDKAGGGGSGAGAVVIIGSTLTVTGTVAATGGGGYDAGVVAGAGGAGGSILLKTDIATLGTSLVTAAGGSGAGDKGGDGGDGSVGRIHIDYATSFTGTTTPTINSILDSSLSTTTGYGLRFAVSSDGTSANSENYTMPLSTDYAIGTWNQFYVTWDASLSTATFYQDAVSLGTRVGSKTAIDDGTAAFAVGCSFDGSSAYQDGFDGLLDDVHLFNDIRTASEILSNYGDELLGTEANLQSYYKLNNGYTDSSASSNTLSASGSPVFSTDVPFSGVTTRADQDQGAGGNGSDYTLQTSINEGATHRQTFVPAKDPQKSIVVTVDTVGTGDWTLTVHDQFNREIAATTIVNANIPASGVIEFIASTAWRPVIGASYHFHVTVSTGTSKIKSDTLGDLEDGLYTSHFQILVTDVDYHPILPFLNFLAIGNERYLAKLEAGNVYDPHKLTLPSGHRIRALGLWREFIAIGTWKGTAITDYDQGRIFFWDGTSATYNFFIDVPEGGINALFGSRGVLYVVAGYNGDILEYRGRDRAEKVKKIPKLLLDKYTEVLPGAMTMWSGLLRIAPEGNGDSTVVEKGVYSWGSKTATLPNALSYDYPISTGTRTGTGLKLGMVFPSGQDLFVGWKDGTSYGVDRVTVSASPFSTGTYETLISDLGSISRKEKPVTARADFEKLASGESVTIKYRLDRETTWQTEVEDTANARFVSITIPSEANEIEIAVDIATTTTTTPTVTGITLESEIDQRSRSA